jgi:hypothetical protein
MRVLRGRPRVDVQKRRHKVTRPASRSYAVPHSGSHSDPLIAGGFPRKYTLMVVGVIDSITMSAPTPE